MKEVFWKNIQAVREQSPLVHNITNYVVMNNTANALLAAGASPIMAHSDAEVADMVHLASSLVINIGTLDEQWASAMYLAARAAHLSNTPWVLDPVGAGATPFRDRVVQELLLSSPTVIRGNASEIKALLPDNAETSKGVDSTAQSSDALEAAVFIAQKQECIVCVSGQHDIVTDGQRQIFLQNGHPLMTKVTGLGCSATALVGAFIAVVEDKLLATASAMALLGVAGQLAQQHSDGSGSLQLHLLDKLYNLTEEEFLSTVIASEDAE